MKKDEVCSKLRELARTHLSPRVKEREFVSKVYASVRKVLGDDRSLRIGSYARFTAVRPLHDLDVLYILGDWSEDADPSDSLEELEESLNSNYENPTSFDTEIARQTHSVTIKFLREGQEKFSVDVVPAYVQGVNEFGDDVYMVPELLTKSHAERRSQAARDEQARSAMTWIASDPRGYITVASHVNNNNSDFRKATKIVKGWRSSCKERDDKFPLKSFHLELLVTQYFLGNPAGDIFDAVFDVFRNLLFHIHSPRIRDRADPNRFIDEYVENLTSSERAAVKEASDHFLIELENIVPDTDPQSLIRCGRRKRASNEEKYLFDLGIPVFSEVSFSIEANVLERAGGFRGYVLGMLGRIAVDRKIKFRLGKDAPKADLFKWKVKNDDSSQQPRGEITDNRTKNDPEHTKFRGKHYVECFAIRSGVCIGRAKQNVVLDGQSQ